MIKTCPITCFLFLASWSPLTWESESIRKEIEVIESELKVLPHTPITMSPWTSGFMSLRSTGREFTSYITIDLPKPELVDLVVLMPAAYVDSEGKNHPLAFPLRFSIRAIRADGSTDILVHHQDEDYPTPYLEPQFFKIKNPKPTSALRITITKYANNPISWGADKCCAMSEVFAFAGDRNVALNAAVKSSKSHEWPGVWSPDYLTDGFFPYEPVDFKLSDPHKNFSLNTEEVTLGFDLGRTHTIDEFRLWPSVKSIPYHNPGAGGIGFPTQIRLMASSSTNNIRLATTIHETESLKISPGNGPLMIRVPPTKARYLWVTMAKGMPDRRSPALQQIALSEIEFMENGRNVSHGITPTGGRNRGPEREKKRRLSDGSSNLGNIIPLRDWLFQFQQRKVLERRLASRNLDLERALARERRRFEWMILSAAILIALLAQYVWVAKARGKRRAARMRERIACDLHDEIGANISSISHTAELLGESIKQPDATQKRLINNLILNARTTSKETKNFIRFIESEGQDRDMTEQFHMVAEQILGTIECSLSLSDPQALNKLDPSTKWNLLLFYKEALNNIIKHSKATSVAVEIQRDRRLWKLSVSDNGHGLEQGESTCKHLKSRAAMLGGNVDIQSPPNEGTRITLTFGKPKKS